MKPFNFRGTLMFLTLLLSAFQLKAQPWTTSGNTLGGGEWFGATTGSNTQLDIQHQTQDYPIVFSTTSAVGLDQRLIISHNSAGEPRIGIGTSSFLTTPITYLHMGQDANVGVDGTRSWMNIGALMTYQSDNMYVGVKDAGGSHTDAIIDWGNNPSGSGTL